MEKTLPSERVLQFHHLFWYPYQSEHHHRIMKVTKNNLNSAKIFTAVMRKSLAFIWGLGFCYYYWFDASQFSNKNKTRKRLRQAASRAVFYLIYFSLFSPNGNSADFSSNCCDGAGNQSQEPPQRNCIISNKYSNIHHKVTFKRNPF